MGVCSKERHLLLRITAVGAVCVGFDEFPDGEPVRGFFGREGDVLAHELISWLDLAARSSLIPFTSCRIVPLGDFGEKSMHEMDRHRALANRGCNPFDAAGACVPHRKYSWHTVLEQERRTAQRPLEVLVSNKVRPGNNEPILVQN